MSETNKKASINDMQYGCMDHIPIMELINFLAKWDLCLVQSANGLAIVKQRKQANGHS